MANAVGYLKSKVDQLLALKQDKDALDEAMAEVAMGDNAFSTAQRSTFVLSDSLVLSPTPPTAPTIGTVWINTTA